MLGTATSHPCLPQRAEAMTGVGAATFRIMGRDCGGGGWGWVVGVPLCGWGSSRLLARTLCGKGCLRLTGRRTATFATGGAWICLGCCWRLIPRFFWPAACRWNWRDARRRCKQRGLRGSLFLEFRWGTRSHFRGWGLPLYWGSVFSPDNGWLGESCMLADSLWIRIP